MGIWASPWLTITTPTITTPTHQTPLRLSWKRIECTPVRTRRLISPVLYRAIQCPRWVDYHHQYHNHDHLYYMITNNMFTYYQNRFWWFNHQYCNFKCLLNWLIRALITLSEITLSIGDFTTPCHVNNNSNNKNSQGPNFGQLIYHSHITMEN